MLLVPLSFILTCARGWNPERKALVQSDQTVTRLYSGLFTQMGSPKSQTGSDAGKASGPADVQSERHPEPRMFCFVFVVL